MKVWDYSLYHNYRNEFVYKFMINYFLETSVVLQDISFIPESSISMISFGISFSFDDQKKKKQNKTIKLLRSHNPNECMVNT